MEELNLDETEGSCKRESDGKETEKGAEEEEQEKGEDKREDSKFVLKDAINRSRNGLFVLLDVN